MRKDTSGTRDIWWTEISRNGEYHGRPIRNSSRRAGLPLSVVARMDTW